MGMNLVCHIKRKHTLRVFKNKDTRIFEIITEKVIGCWRNLYNVDIQNFYSQHITRIIKSRRTKLTGHVA
jgi:hypothetical protein